MGEKSNAHVQDILLEPIGNTGEVIMAVKFDRKVEIPGRREFGFPLRRHDAEALYQHLGRILSRNRIISVPGGGLSGLVK